jgi:hypothetical protein
MQIPISQQLIQAASSLILGAAAGFIYDLFRVVRRRARSKAVTAATDFLFWLITGLAVFLLGLSLGGGRQRLFMNIMAVLGAILYFVTLSRYSLVLCNAIADAVVFVLYCLSRPFVWVYFAYKKLRIFLKNIFHYAFKWYKIYADNTPRARHGKKRGKGVGHEAEKSRYHYEDRHIRSDRLRLGDAYQSEVSDRRGPLPAGSPQAASRGKRNLERRAQVRNRPQR